MITFLKIILVIVILVAMIVLLLGLDQLFTGRFDADSSDANRLRDEVEKHKDVISDNNVFNSLVQRSRKLHDTSTESKRN